MSRFWMLLSTLQLAQSSSSSWLFSQSDMLVSQSWTVSNSETSVLRRLSTFSKDMQIKSNCPFFSVVLSSKDVVESLRKSGKGLISLLQLVEVVEFVPSWIGAEVTVVVLIAFRASEEPS